MRRVNEYGFIETPYRVVDKKTGCVTNEIRYMTADEEDMYVIAQANEPIDDEGHFINARITCRDLDKFVEVPPENVDLVDVSPKQLVSVATGMIPFLENDDANRALMGSNMQRQAVPLLVPESPIVGTGIEGKAAYDSGVLVKSKQDGIVRSVSADRIEIEDRQGEVHTYKLIKYSRSNQGTCINQLPLVHKGQPVSVGDILADGPSTDKGEIALGKNILMGFMTWEGYNYEDAVLISERLVKDDVFTSIHIEEYEAQARDTKLGPEEITRDIPNVGSDALKDLDASRHHPHRRRGAQRGHSGWKSHAQGGDRAYRRRAPAARHLWRKGPGGAGYFAARAARRSAASLWMSKCLQERIKMS